VLSRSIPIYATAMASCPSLRVISRAAAGYDVVDVAAATDRGIAVLTAVSANAQSVVEFTIDLEHFPIMLGRSLRRRSSWRIRLDGTCR
jgi:D-3-phosphoglycerate dehydrogenase